MTSFVRRAPQWRIAGVPLITDISDEVGDLSVTSISGGVDISMPTGDRLILSGAQKNFLAEEFQEAGPTVTDTLLANGDSVTYGQRPGVTLAQTFVQQVGVARGFANIVNTAVPGHTSTQMLSHWASDLATYNPSTVFIMASANNAANGISIAQNEADMVDMIEMALDAGARVTIASHWPYIESTNLNGYALEEYDMMQRLAGLDHVQYVEVWCHMIRALFRNGSVSSADAYFRSLYALDGEGQPDWIHPSAIGHQLITELIMKNPRACAR